MKTNTAIIGLAIAFVCTNTRAVYSCPDSAKQAFSSTASVPEVVAHLVGVMDTSNQAQTNPKISSVRMTTCQVRVTDMQPSAVFLYQEQALSEKLSQPYRQRFLRISAVKNSKLVESAGFKPPKPESWVGLCNQPEAKRLVSSNDLGKTECSVFLQKEGNNYVGETQPGGCPTNFKGAVKITNHITLHANGMETWDRGYDAQGNIIWGAKQEPYQYLWVNSAQLSK
ncbi:chromophore lyase CpcT/CpeT [Merismopedia glauca]|uniref:Chromophore lyase CpcT/CpeT n=1 Tax=Merismopedia glauca CCAP 1448/3 TaxID=1296344 RepID=A0A2T1C8R0_9CYAN|nr:chromophore lyase CpcT/CpeT [Merismopedia glauca]PSB04548.1 chorismate mutase [Merismopedia glauca CCAP 1448/3]